MAKDGGNGEEIIKALTSGLSCGGKKRFLQENWRTFQTEECEQRSGGLTSLTFGRMVRTLCVWFMSGQVSKQRLMSLESTLTAVP